MTKRYRTADNARGEGAIFQPPVVLTRQLRRSIARGNPAIKNPKVQQAMRDAIDRLGLAEVLGKDKAR